MKNKDVEELYDEARHRPTCWYRPLRQPSGDRFRAEDVVHQNYASEQERRDRLAGASYWLNNFLPLYGELTNLEQNTIAQIKEFIAEGNAIEAENTIVWFIGFLFETASSPQGEQARLKRLTVERRRQEEKKS